MLLSFIENTVRNTATTIGNTALDMEINYHENCVKGGSSEKKIERSELEELSYQLNMEAVTPELLGEKIEAELPKAEQTDALRAAIRGYKIALSVFDKMLVHTSRDGFSFWKKEDRLAEATLMRFFCIGLYKNYNLDAKEEPSLKDISSLNSRYIMIDDTSLNEAFNHICFEAGMNLTLDTDIKNNSFVIKDEKGLILKYRGKAAAADDLNVTEEDIKARHKAESKKPQKSKVISLTGPVENVIDCEVTDGKAVPKGEKKAEPKKVQKPVSSKATEQKPKQTEAHEPIVIFHTQEEAEGHQTRRPEWMEEKLFDRLEKFMSEFLPNVEHEYLKFNNMIIQISFIDGREPILIDDGSMYALGVRILYDGLPVSINSVDKIKQLYSRYPRELSKKERARIESKMFLNKDIYRYFDFSEVKDIIVQLPEADRIKLGKKLEGIINYMSGWMYQLRFRITEFESVNKFKLISDNKVRFTGEMNWYYDPKMSYFEVINDEATHVVPEDTTTTFDLMYQR